MANITFGLLLCNMEKTILFGPRPKVKDKININQNITQAEPDEKHSGCILNAQNSLSLKLA